VEKPDLSLRKETLLKDYLQELASHSPFGLNFTDDTAFVWPARVYFNV